MIEILHSCFRKLRDISFSNILKSKLGNDAVMKKLVLKTKNQNGKQLKREVGKMIRTYTTAKLKFVLASQLIGIMIK